MKHSQQIIRVARTGYGLLLEQNGEYRVCSSKVSWLDLSSSPSMFQDAMKFFKKGPFIRAKSLVMMNSKLEVIQVRRDRLKQKQRAGNLILHTHVLVNAGTLQNYFARPKNQIIFLALVMMQVFAQLRICRR